MTLVQIKVVSWVDEILNFRLVDVLEVLQLSRNYLEDLIVRCWAPVNVARNILYEVNV